MRQEKMREKRERENEEGRESETLPSAEQVVFRPSEVAYRFCVKTKMKMLFLRRWSFFAQETKSP